MYKRQAFERLGYKDYFDIILTCGEVGASKSNPKIFFEAIAELGTPIEDTWLFEDGLYSIKTAKADVYKRQLLDWRKHPPPFRP